MKTSPAIRKAVSKYKKSKLYRTEIAINIESDPIVAQAWKALIDKHGSPTKAIKAILVEAGHIAD